MACKGDASVSRGWIRVVLPEVRVNWVIRGIWIMFVPGPEIRVNWVIRVVWVILSVSREWIRVVLPGIRVNWVIRVV